MCGLIFDHDSMPKGIFGIYAWRNITLVETKEEGEDYVTAASQALGITREEARREIGFYLGSFENDIRKRIEPLLGCEHPIFGAVAEMGFPTLKEALDCGEQNITLKQLRENATSRTKSLPVLRSPPRCRNSNRRRRKNATGR